MTLEQQVAALEKMHAQYPPDASGDDAICDFACTLEGIACPDEPDLCQRIRKVIEERSCNCPD